MIVIRAPLLAALLLVAPCVLAWAGAMVADSPREVTPLEVGELIPDASARDPEGQPVQLSALVGGRPTLIVFYRGGWCPFCTTRLGELQFMESRLLEIGVALVAMSPDRPEKLRRTRDELALRYRLLSDASMEIARGFGVAYQVTSKDRKRLEGMGIDLEEASGQKHHQLPVASLFLVDGDGKIRFRYLSVHHREWLNPEQLFEAARAAVED
jgi:peroxiredoxin